MIQLKERVYHLIAEYDQDLACLYQRQYRPTPYIISDINPRKSIESQSQFWLSLFYTLEDVEITDKAKVLNVLMNTSMKLNMDIWLTEFEQQALPVFIQHIRYH